MSSSIAPNKTPSTPSSSENRKSVGPIDLDQTPLSPSSAAPIHDDHSCLSDFSVGDITETSISDETPSEKQRMTALATSLSEKQQGISWAFAGMVTKMAALIDEKETENERLIGYESKESQRRRQEQADKCTNAVNAMAKKQARITKQFQKIIAQLEVQNQHKDEERVQLKKQIAQMREKMKKLKAFAAVERSSATGGTHKHSFSQRPPRPSIAPSKTSEHPSNPASPNDTSTHATEPFSIKEIAFSSTIVDIAAITEDIDNVSISSNHEYAGENVRLLL
jgi:hypothetical protein